MAKGSSCSPTYQENDKKMPWREWSQSLEKQGMIGTPGCYLLMVSHSTMKLVFRRHLESAGVWYGAHEAGIVLQSPCQFLLGTLPTIREAPASAVLVCQPYSQTFLSHTNTTHMCGSTAKSPSPPQNFPFALSNPAAWNDLPSLPNSHCSPVYKRLLCQSQPVRAVFPQREMLRRAS